MSYPFREKQIKDSKFRQISLSYVAVIITVLSVSPTSNYAFAKSTIQFSYEETLSMHRPDRLLAQSLGAKQITINEEYQTYTNARYRFAIDFPKDWHIEKESANGDGMSLYTGNSSVDIRAFASPCLGNCVSSAKEAGFKKKTIRLNNSQIANVFLGIEDNQIVYKVSFSLKDIEYTFYSKAPKTFFHRNEANLARIGKSLRVLENNTSDNK
jgi:hypothetical protein